MEELARALEVVADRVYLLGREVAGSELPVISDPPGLVGPLAGMVAAFREFPGAAWVFASCDLPGVRVDGIHWLASQRGRGRWAVVPTVGGRSQPLLAIYEPPAGPLLESVARDGSAAPRRLASHPRVHTPEPPEELSVCWRDVDCPEELASWPGLS